MNSSDTAKMSVLRSNPIYFCSPLQSKTLLTEQRRLVLFVRHGLTDWNLEMRLQGREDIPLNEAGIKQAGELAALFEKALEAGLRTDRVYTSPLSRAYDTAKLISERVSQCPPEVLEGLIERDYSSLSGLTLKKRKQLYPSPKKYPPDMETVPCTAQRIKRVLLGLTDSSGGNTAIAVTHGGVINALFAYITGGRAGTNKKISFNCSVAAVAAGQNDVIPLAFNLHGQAFINYLSELYN